MKHCINCTHCVIDVKALNCGVVIDKCLKNGHLILRPFFSGFRCEDYRRDRPTADVAPKSELAREIIDIVERRIENAVKTRRGIKDEFWEGVYCGRVEAYRDIKEIIEQKYTEEQT